MASETEGCLQYTQDATFEPLLGGSTEGWRPLKVLGRQMWVHSWRGWQEGPARRWLRSVQWRSGVRQAGVPRGGFLPRRLSAGGERSPLAALWPQVLKLGAHLEKPTEVGPRAIV